MRLRQISLIFSAGMVLFLPAAVGTTATAYGGGFGNGIIGESAGVGGFRYLHRSLDLTPEQEEQILATRQEFYRNSLALRERLQQLRLELRRLWAEEKPNAAAINRKLTEMTPLRIELRAMALETWERIKTVLTPEQLEKLESVDGRVLMRRKGRGWQMHANP